ncbi:Gfo/Idh/MocA family protein [Kribbella sindirgiensis]|uniref:Gfo/Idh/MocA family oxidoreductase n=1 Tax=Kribbella sindirgiensis TaxID=1124744 RepID=A0A4R0IDH5_9ACTN|nr:Gfo/Idh/MocA family oxidoreductase [Kribbella sindirgiensis]TCC28838.1 Gfo/Idh/MocA family oxidoreductase [Kribbella sindirgiensis]
MVTIGIVGAGLRGRLFAEALEGQPDVTVVGLAEPSVKVAEEARAATGLPVTASHAELLGAFDPDAVIVATPDFAHRQIAVDVAEAGKHLLIEKPVATTVDDARAIAAAVHRAGVRCLVGFENRWNPHVVQAKAAIANLGRPITASATLSNSFFVPTTMLSWAAQSSPAWFLLPHTLDLVLWLTGRKPESVSAVGSRGVLAERGIDTWDVVHALVTFDDGSTATLSSAWTLPDAGDGIVDFRFQVIGTGGSVTADLSHQGLTVVSDKHRSVWPVSGRIGRSQVGPAVWMVQDFAAGLVDGGDLGPGIDHGVLVTQIICAIEDSISTGQTVHLSAPTG